MVSLQDDRTYTIEEYLQLDMASELRLEYSRGRITNMSGGSFNHSLISSNTTRQLGNLVSNKNCLVLNSDLKVYMEKIDQFRYPDGMAICGPVTFPFDEKTAISNPVLIIEVLSPSTMQFDRTEKFREYCTLPSFKEYVMIEQDRPIVEVLFREEKGLWKMRTFIGLDKTVHLDSLNIDISMADIYANVQDLTLPNYAD